MDILGNVQKLQQPVMNKILPALSDLRIIQISKHYASIYMILELYDKYSL